MLCTNILLSGNNYRKVALLFKFMAMGMVCESTFFKVQDTYCIEPVEEYWEKTRGEVLDRLRQKDHVVVLGEKYCFPTTRTEKCHAVMVGLYATSATFESNACNVCLQQVMAEWTLLVSSLLILMKLQITIEFTGLSAISLSQRIAF